MSIVNLSAPWVQYYRKLEAMFKHDNNVTVVFDGTNIRCDLYVDGDEKAEALTKLLKPTVEFGNVVMPVIVHPSDEISAMYENKLAHPYAPSRYVHNATAPYEQDAHYIALNTNSAMSSVEYKYGPGGAVFTYVIFRPKVVQYFADDISDYYGSISTLYENIARDIFVEETGVYYCTDLILPRRRRDDEEVDFG